MEATPRGVRLLRLVPSERARPEGEHARKRRKQNSHRPLGGGFRRRSVSGAPLTRNGRLPAFPCLARAPRGCFHRVNGFVYPPVTWNALELVTAPGLERER
jgi:hypothetical protein